MSSLEEIKARRDESSEDISYLLDLVEKLSKALKQYTTNDLIYEWIQCGQPEPVIEIEAEFYEPAKNALKLLDKNN